MPKTGSAGRRARVAAVSIISIAAIGSAPDGRGAAPAGIHARAPFVILAEGFHHISGVAVDARGAVLVADEARGTVTQIDGAGGLTTLLRELHDPIGVAVDSAGAILVLERGGGRLLRVDGEGVVAVLASGLKQPRAIAVAPDDRIWLATGDAVGRLEAGGFVAVADGFVDVQALAVDRSSVYVALKRFAHQSGHGNTAVARVSLLPDGDVPEHVLAAQLSRATGVAIDATGDIVVGGAADGNSGMIVKPGAGTAAVFAAGLIGAAAVAFAPAGDLIAAEEGSRGRIIRFNAPAAPRVSSPVFTNRSPASINGSAALNDLIRVFYQSDTTVTGTTVASSGTGQFAVSVGVALNAATDLVFRATAAAGAGLVSPLRAVHVVHDDHIPRVAILEPQSHTFARSLVALRATAEDEGSGIKELRLMLDDDAIAVVDNTEAGSPLTAAASVDAGLVAEGAHTLTAVATDRAGNVASMAQLAVVDRTPPDTYIASSPPGETMDVSASFVAGATDALSSSFTFSWRLDGNAWSQYGPAAITVANLSPGPHRFEVTARDEAGNEDQTPAVQDFSVVGLTIHVLEPTRGTVVSGSLAWVRGTVQAGGRDVNVTISTPPELRAEVMAVTGGLDVFQAAVEGGMFAANAWVTSSTTAITVTADDGQGHRVAETVALSVEGADSSIGDLRAFPDAGLAPHTLRFGASAPDAMRYQIDLESDGIVDYDVPSLNGQDFVYTRPGVYVPTVIAITPAGGTREFRTVVQVYDAVALNGRLQAVWRGLRDALRAGDIPAATSFIHSTRRATWAQFFGQFTPEMFAQADSVFTDIAIVEVSPNRIECEETREENGVSYSFPVSFELDNDGRWQLWQF